MDLNAKELLNTLEFDAIKKEMENLREWYFYESRHTNFNAMYMEFLEKTGKTELTSEERLKIAESYYAEAIAYMNYFYPAIRPDIEVPVLQKSTRAKSHHENKGKINKNTSKKKRKKQNRK